MKNIILDSIGLIVMFAFFYLVLTAEPALTQIIVDWKNPPV